MTAAKPSSILPISVSLSVVSPGCVPGRRTALLSEAGDCREIEQVLAATGRSPAERKKNKFSAVSKKARGGVRAKRG